MPEALPSPVPHRFTIENRTGEAVDLTFVDRTTGQPGRLWIDPGAAGTIDGDPGDLRWLNVPENPPHMLAAEAADAIDARRGPSDAPWRGLTVRMEAMPA